MKRLRHFERAIFISAPVECVYRQCLRLEDYPAFAPSIVGIHSLGDSQFLWQLKIWGKRIKQRLEICEKDPGHFIAWRSRGRRFHYGLITFEPQGRDRTRVRIEVDYEPRGIIGKIWAAFGAVERSISAVLQGLRHFAERPVSAAPTWREEFGDRGFQPAISAFHA